MKTCDIKISFLLSAKSLPQKITSIINEGFFFPKEVVFSDTENVRHVTGYFV